MADLSSVLRSSTSSAMTHYHIYLTMMCVRGVGREWDQSGIWIELMAMIRGKHVYSDSFQTIHAVYTAQRDQHKESCS